MLSEIIRQKKPPVTGAKQQGSCIRSKDHVKFWSNESAGLPTPEQPTRLAEISATDSRISYQVSPVSTSLRLSHAVFIGVDLLNRQSQDVKQKIQALTDPCQLGP